MSYERGSGSEPPTERIVEQRIRNRVIEYLDLAASFEEQREYERNVPIAHIPYEVINQWEDNFPQGPQAEVQRSTVFSPDEIAAITEFHTVWVAVARAIPDDYPTLEAVQRCPHGTGCATPLHMHAMCSRGAGRCRKIVKFRSAHMPVPGNRASVAPHLLGLVRLCR